MIENGVYIIKQEYFTEFEKLGCRFKDNKSGNRPTFCCLKDKYIEELFWAIPTSRITMDKNMKRIEYYINMPRSTVASSYYHIGHTNIPCVFCISSTFPVIDRYVEREYTVNGQHLIINDELQSAQIKKKLGTILQAENKFPNRFEQRITYIQEILKKQI
ncbi:MAG: hypothetical protein FWF46_05830 [Oscillospiraceae bacterium]|nr:hypothetical protein [Oscillospiraceae bacterium]